MTRGHNIVADGWAGASNPHPHPNLPQTLKHTQKVSKTLVFPRFNSMTLDGRTNGPTDGRTDKASYRVACPQLKSDCLWLEKPPKSNRLTLFISLWQIPSHPFFLSRRDKKKINFGEIDFFGREFVFLCDARVKRRGLSIKTTAWWYMQSLPIIQYVFHLRI